MEQFQYKTGVSFRIERNFQLENHFKILIFQDEKEVGFCRFEVKANGTYYFSAFVIYKEHRGKNLGSNLIECVNDFLKNKRAIGYLSNTIEDADISNLYESHGWKRVVSNLYTFDGSVN